MPDLAVARVYGGPSCKSDKIEAQFDAMSRECEGGSQREAFDMDRRGVETMR